MFPKFADLEWPEKYHILKLYQRANYDFEKGNILFPNKVLTLWNTIRVIENYMIDFEYNEDYS